MRKVTDQALGCNRSNPYEVISMVGIIGALKTSRLWDRILAATSLDELLESCEASNRCPQFHEYINALCAEQNMPPAQIIQRSGIERSYCYQIFRGIRRPSRDMVLLLSFGFSADVETTQSLLKHARHGMLYPRVPRDVVIAYCIHNRYTLIMTQQALANHNLPIIGAIPQ